MLFYILLGLGIWIFGGFITAVLDGWFEWVPEDHEHDGNLLALSLLWPFLLPVCLAEAGHNKLRTLKNKRKIRIAEEKRIAVDAEKIIEEEFLALEEEFKEKPKKMAKVIEKQVRVVPIQDPPSKKKYNDFVEIEDDFRKIVEPLRKRKINPPVSVRRIGK